MNIEELKRLAGVDNVSTEDSMGENLSYVGTKKTQHKARYR